MKTKILFIVFGLLSSFQAFAYDFEVDGFYYNIVSLDDLTCEITFREQYRGCYTGDVVIPSTVVYKTKTLTVVSINTDTFCSCDYLTSVTIPHTVTTIKNFAFYRCPLLKSLTIPNSVTYINSSAFSDCSNLKKLVFEDGNTTLTVSPYFLNNSSTENIYLGRNLIGQYSSSPFKNNTNLKELTFGSSVTLIVGSLLSGCTNITSFTSLNPIPPTVGDNNFTNSHYINAVLYVPQDAMDTYKAADCWKNFWNIEAVNEETTGIEAAEAASEDAPATIYDLQGRRLSEPQKGINIIGGKKVVVK